MSRPLDQHRAARIRRLVVLSDALSVVLTMDDDALTAGEVRLLTEARDVVENICDQSGRVDHD